MAESNENKKICFARVEIVISTEISKPPVGGPAKVTVDVKHIVQCLLNESDVYKNEKLWLRGDIQGVNAYGNKQKDPFFIEAVNNEGILHSKSRLKFIVYNKCGPCTRNTRYEVKEVEFVDFETGYFEGPLITEFDARIRKLTRGDHFPPFRPNPQVPRATETNVYRNFEVGTAQSAREVPYYGIPYPHVEAPFTRARLPGPFPSPESEAKTLEFCRNSVEAFLTDMGMGYKFGAAWTAFEIFMGRDRVCEEGLAALRDQVCTDTDWDRLDPDIVAEAPPEPPTPGVIFPTLG